MKIAVLVKQVPDTESKLMLSADCKSIDESQLAWVMNPFDEYAVEQAILLKEASGGEVIIFTVGPARAEEVIRQAFAVGADRGVRIDAEGDSFITANLLAKAIETENCDLVLAGKKSVDLENGSVHIGVAEILGWPHVTPVEEFSMHSDGVASVTRPSSGSMKEHIEVKFPAVIGCEKGLNEPRYPTLPGRLKAKSKTIDVMSTAGSSQGDDPLVNVVNYSTAPERKAAQILRGDVQEVTQELVRLLREEAKVI